MANNRQFRIDSVPEEESTSMNTTQGVPRDEANVEAEKGETMVTTDGVSNQNKIVAIGGEKHSDGGTPLNVEEGTIIYSDNLKVKDPLLLKFFNESGKKQKTFAELSKKYDITKWQKELENPDNDRITNTSLEKNVDDGNFKLSALFAIQEFHEKKGSPEEHSKHFEPFMERMGINYDQLFGTEGQEGEDTEPLLAKNGIEVGFDELPEMHKGGNIPLHDHKPDGSHLTDGSYVPGAGKKYPYKDRYQQAGLDEQNATRANLNLPLLDKSAIGSKAKFDAGAKEIQQWFKANPKLATDYGLNTSGDESKSDRPTEKMQRGLRKLGKTPLDGVSFTNNELLTYYESGDIDDEWIADGLSDGLWTYRSAHSNIKEISKKEMNSLKSELDANGILANDGNTYLYKGPGHYEAYRINPDGSIERVEPNAKVIDGSYNWDNKRSIDVAPKERNMDYRWDHKRATAQAIKNKRKIPRLSPFTPIEETTYADQIYYNPDQAISSMQSMVDNAGTKNAMFAPQQQQTANFLANQQFEMMGKLIGQYEDKNVAAYNRERLTNTNIANRSSQRLAQAISGHHDKSTILKQEYANARTIADNNIAENEIAMWNERRNRLNLESTIGEQYATDPNTGLHTFERGKDYAADNTNASKQISDMVATIKRRFPDMEDRAVVDLAKSAMSGNYDVTIPNEDNYNN
tara:strand:- start:5040 stop:7106 length:2067 start_codon:yes stop_codon:yes gene_type:complete